MVLANSPAAQAAQVGEIRIRVLQGEGQSLVIGSQSNVDAVIQVVDGSGNPVPNANVTFLLGSGGTTLDDLTTLVVTADSQGRATCKVRPTGQTGTWSIRVTASAQQQRTTATITLSNVTEAPRVAPAPKADGGEPVAAATPSSPPVTSTAPAKKSNKTLLIVLLIAAGAGGGLAAALGGKKGSTTTEPGNTIPVTSTTTISIGLGSGGFGTPGVH